MRLSLLYESLGTGAVAIRPAALGGQTGKTSRSPGKDRWYLKFSRKDNENISEDGSKKKLPEGNPNQPSTNVWQWLKPKKKKQWHNKYAATNNPDERLLKNFRGKGY